MELQNTYVWLDKIKSDLEKDLAMDQEIKAIETCKSLIRQKITGICQSEIEVTNKISGCIFTNETEVEYFTVPTIIAFRSSKDVERLNKIAKNKNLPIHAIEYGNVPRGFNVKGRRPNVLIMTFECENDLERKWLDELGNCMDNDFTLIVNN